jgi:hypothetical protein
MEEAFLGLFRFFRSLGGSARAAVLALAFAAPAVRREGGRIVVEGALEGAITPEVQRVLETGTPVEIRYTGRLQKVEVTDSAVLRHDSLSGAWLVERNGTRSTVATLEEASAHASRYRVSFPDPGPGPLELEIEASLHHPGGLDVPAADAALWNHRTPYLRIHHLERMLE